jgi:carboxylesterase
MNNPILLNPQLEGEAFEWESGPVGVLLFHGYTATTCEVRLLARELFNSGYSVSCPLLPGHGTTPEALNRTHWSDWTRAGEAAYLRLSQCCQRVIVGGESAGALIALYLASQHPEIAAVLCYAPALKLLLKPIDIATLYLASPFVVSIPKGSIDVSTGWQGYTVNPLKGAIELLKLERDVTRRLPSISQPLFIASGRLDTTIDPAGVDLIYQNVRSSLKEKHLMEHSSHVVLLDQELETISALTLNFLQRALQDQVTPLQKEGTHA